MHGCRGAIGGEMWHKVTVHRPERLGLARDRALPFPDVFQVPVSFRPLRSLQSTPISELHKSFVAAMSASGAIDYAPVSCKPDSVEGSSV